MSYTVIARKYRPQNFDELVGQEPIAKTLSMAIKLNKIHHAYLFSGPRGVGKTSTARILAKSLNCKNGPTPEPCGKCQNCIEITEGRSLDVIEIDGASNRGIDEIRDLKEKVQFRPINSNYKIYIIDEVHMLTKEAFNALLKTLEEPPDHVVFIFATTEPHKIPLTVLSRCQRYNFRRISIDKIAGQLNKILKAENIEAEEDALFLVAKQADGSLRDAQSSLDQLIAFSEGIITAEKVREMFGLTTSDTYKRFVKYIINEDVKKGMELIHSLYMEGNDLKLFVSNLMEYIRNIFLIKTGITDVNILELAEHEVKELEELSREFEEENLEEMLNYLTDLLNLFKFSNQFKTLLEIAFVRLINIYKKVTLRFIYDYINSFEKDFKREVEEKKNIVKDQKLSSHNNYQEASNNIPSKHTEKENKFSDKLADKWKEFLESLPIPVAALVREGKIQGIKNNTIYLSFLPRHKFHYTEAQKQKNLEIIINNLRKIFNNANINIQFIMEDINEPEAKKKNNLPEEVRKGIELSEKIFKGKIVKICKEE